MASQSRDAAIVGIYELPERKVAGLSPLQIKAECAAKALADAGLTWSDVDAIYDAGEAGGGMAVAEYFGLHPRVMDTTGVGGSSYEFHAAHARRDIAAGRANVALLTYGSIQASAATRRDTGAGGGGGGVPDPDSNMGRPWGQTLISMYALAAQRHMHEFGTTSEQLAEIATATRAHAMRNPQAVKAMEDLLFRDIRETTVEDVVTSRMIATPLRLLDCCMVSDGGGAVVIASPEVARGCAKPPVWIIGAGEAIGLSARTAATSRRARGRSPRRSRSARRASAPDEIDIAMVYDSFTITVLMLLEDLGFCAKGEGGAWVEGGRLRWDHARRPGAQHRRRRPLLEPPRHARHLPAAGGGPAVARRVHVAGGGRGAGRRPRQRRPTGEPALGRHDRAGTGLGRTAMTDATRPLPSLADPDTGPFWQATKAHELRYQVCDDCNTVVFYPRRHCTGCVGGALSWRTSKGEGAIYSYSVVQLSRHPFFGQKIPYAVALIDLDEGFRMLSSVVGVDGSGGGVERGPARRVGVGGPRRSRDPPLPPGLAARASVERKRDGDRSGAEGARLHVAEWAGRERARWRATRAGG